MIGDIKPPYGPFVADGGEVLPQDAIAVSEVATGWRLPSVWMARVLCEGATASADYAYTNATVQVALGALGVMKSVIADRLRLGR